MKLFLIFPTQLFELNKISNDFKSLRIDKIFIIEEPIYFTKYKFHKLKLAFHRASMKCYFDYLKSKKYDVKYYEFKDNYLSDLKNNDIFFYNPIDHTLVKKLEKTKLTMLESPEFITTHEDLLSYYNSHKDKKFMHDSSFYRWQRNRLKILTPISSNAKTGAKSFALSYDKGNREPFSKNQKEVFNPSNNSNKYITEAKQYVNKHFSDNWGSMDNFIYPITHLGAKKWLKLFIDDRLTNFGKYEDAFHSKIKFGYHSVLSPLLNIGLLTDKDILDALMPYSKKQINSLEGYIRQLIGWKQSMRYLYEFHFNKFCLMDKGGNMKGLNFLNHTKKMSKRFWDATTGIPPVDACIQKANEYSYLHHIERLMIMGQFFLLTMIHPDEVYNWFISVVSIDSYEWVMVPNIYGMIMYADGGFMMSRPYFSSSAYIKKMSGGEYAKDGAVIKLGDGKEYKWDSIWDALYYNLINTHYTKFKKIYATARNVYHWDNKTKKEQDQLIKLAKLYLVYL